MNKIFAIGIVGGIMTLSISPVMAVVEPTDTPTPEPTVTTTPTPSNTPKATNAPNPIRTPRPTRDVTALKEAALTKAKEATKNLFRNQFIKRLGDIKALVNGNERIGTDAKATILAKLDSETVWFNAKLVEVDAATTLEEVRNIAKEARTRFQDTVQEVRRLHFAAGYVVSLENIITRLDEELIPKTADRLEALAEKGVDVSEAEGYLSQVQAEVNAAAALVPQIRNSTSYESAKALFEEAKDHLGQSRTFFKSLVDSLRAQIQVLKETSEATATPTETVVVE